jgi:hypothetical protein
MPGPGGLQYRSSFYINLYRIIQNAYQIFHMDPWKPNSLESAHIRVHDHTTSRDLC